MGFDKQTGLEWHESTPVRAPNLSQKAKVLHGSTNGNRLKRKRIVVVGFGMVGIAFMLVTAVFHSSPGSRADENDSEKILKLDAKRREYEVVVIGDEPHLAYNRVGLTTFFEHRVVENLYVNPKEWVSIKGHRPSAL